MKKILIAIAALALISTNANAQLNYYQTGFRLIDGSQLNKMVDVVNGLSGQGGTPQKGYFSLNSTVPGPTPSTGTVIQAVGANAAIARIEVDAFGNAPIVSLRRADGTKAAPTVIQSADQLGSFNFYGATSSSAYYGPSSRLTALATELWSGTAGGTKLVLSVTPNTTQTLTDAVTINQDSGVGITSASANALAVGRLGTTTPALQVDASTATSITGIVIKSAASGGGIALSALGANNENITIDAKGSGTLTLQNVATGGIVLKQSVNGTNFAGSGRITALNATATPVAASAVPSFCMGTSNICIYWGTGSPNTALTASKGSLFIATDGSSSSTRMFINSDGSTAWVAVTTAS